MSEITATLFNYYHVCHRKMWLHAHHIRFENEYDAVSIGRLIHETSYPRQNRKEIIIDGIKLDFVDGAGIVHEVKKSDKLEESHIWQLKYYLYVLAQKGIEGMTGQLNYPKQRKTMDVFLEEGDVEEIERQLEAIRSILESSQSPKVKRMSICKKCSFEEFCWG